MKLTFEAHIICIKCLFPYTHDALRWTVYFTRFLERNQCQIIYHSLNNTEESSGRYNSWQIFGCCKTKIKILFRQIEWESAMKCCWTIKCTTKEKPSTEFNANIYVFLSQFVSSPRLLLWMVFRCAVEVCVMSAKQRVILCSHSVVYLYLLLCTVCLLLHVPIHSHTSTIFRLCYWLYPYIVCSISHFSPLVLSRPPSLSLSLLLCHSFYFSSSLASS